MQLLLQLAKLANKKLMKGRYGEKTVLHFADRISLYNCVYMQTVELNPETVGASSGHKKHREFGIRH